MNEEKQEHNVNVTKAVKTEENEQPVWENAAISMDEEFVPLLEEDNADDFRSRWLDIQTRFVDDPHNSVENADTLVADLMRSITEAFADERSSLEAQWNQGGAASTEDLRVAMMHYRSFFNRLLTLEFSKSMGNLPGH